jgi:hypothetical protein
MKQKFVLIQSKKKQEWFDMDLKNMRPYDIRFKILQSANPDYSKVQILFWTMKELTLIKN